MSVNRVILLGYVGADPEVRYPEKDKPIARVSLATNEIRDGIETTDWHRLYFYGEAAGTVERYVRKGQRLYVEGAIHYREYTDKFNIQRRIADIVVSDFEMLGQR